MKIALLIYGFVRNLEESYKQHKFFLETYDCDVYISTWTNLGRKKKPKKYGDKTTDWIDYEELLDIDKLLSLFNPVAYEIEDINNFNSKYDDIFINNYLKENNFTSYSRCKNSIIGQFYRVKSLWNMFEVNKNKNTNYNLIVRSRFDNVFPNINLNNIVKDDCMYVSNWFGRDIGMDGVDDFLYISNCHQTMKILCNVFEYVLTETQDMRSDKFIIPTQGRSGPVPEFIIAHLLRRNNININSLGIKFSLIK